jgi:hypothetical protein
MCLLKSVILATWEVEIWRIKFLGQRQKVCKTPFHLCGASYSAIREAQIGGMWSRLARHKVRLYSKTNQKRKGLVVWVRGRALA